MTRLPHIREPDREEPDVCVHCRLPWPDLFTDRDTDECPARLRAALDARSVALRWQRHPNNPRAYRLILGSGPNEITVGCIRSGYDRCLGHVYTVASGAWSETARCTRVEASQRLCRHIGIGATVEDIQDMIEAALS